MDMRVQEKKMRVQEKARNKRSNASISKTLSSSPKIQKLMMKFPAA